VKKIVKNPKSTKADKLAAINAGTRLLAIRHRIMGASSEEGFFGK